jgi:hypothetical protein
MPHRLVCVAILLFWTIAAGSLFTRDVLPTLVVGTPPDLRTVTKANNRSTQTRWSIQVADSPQGMNLRAVGQLTTKNVHKRDGYVRLSSEAWFDSVKMLHGTPLATAEGSKLEVIGEYEVDATGNLFQFHAAVRDGPPPAGELLVLDGHLEENSIRVHAKGFLPILNWTKVFPYQPRGMVQNTLGPLDRMPGLHVGQRWETQVISPLTGRVEIGRVEVTGKRSIYWDDKLVSTLEVVTRVPPFSARTWVRPDGLVLRQEVPLLMMNLMLDRIPDSATEQVSSQ